MAPVFQGPNAKRYDPRGTGLIRPFRRGPTGDFFADSGVSVIMSNLAQILGTPAGTFPWRTDFGSSLERLRHKANTPALRDLASVYVTDAFTKWEPRANLASLTVPEPKSLGEANQVVAKATVSIQGADVAQPLNLPVVPAGQWPIQSTATVRIAGTTILAARGVGRLVAPVKQISSGPVMFAGGLVLPVQRTSDWKNGFGADVIISNVAQVLGTPRGLFPWRPEFGSDFEKLRHRNNTPALRELARVYAQDALQRWEPRAQLRSVDVDGPQSAEQNSIDVHVACGVAVVRNDKAYSANIKINV